MATQTYLHAPVEGVGPGHASLVWLVGCHTNCDKPPTAKSAPKNQIIRNGAHGDLVLPSTSSAPAPSGPPSARRAPLTPARPHPTRAPPQGGPVGARPGQPAAGDSGQPQLPHAHAQVRGGVRGAAGGLHRHHGAGAGGGVPGPTRQGGHHAQVCHAFRRCGGECVQGVPPRPALPCSACACLACPAWAA